MHFIEFSGNKPAFISIVPINLRTFFAINLNNDGSIKKIGRNNKKTTVKFGIKNDKTKDIKVGFNISIAILALVFP